jgi:DNA-binding PadR family transcriptional regulator
MNDLLLLSTLLAGPRHGYALKKQIALITGQGEMHNNLVYPLLKRFVFEGWVSRRETAGERGQTRELYAITAKGRQELQRRLSDFPPKSAASAEAFSFRIGLFDILDVLTRRRILDEREKWLVKRADKLAAVAGAMPLGHWAGAVVTFLRAQALSEQRWITKLRKTVVTSSRRA